MIPVTVKIYKLLINELSNQMESNMSTHVSGGGDLDEVNSFQGTVCILSTLSSVLSTIIANIV